MADLEAKKRRYLATVLIVGNVGMFVGALGMLALSPIPTRLESIAEYAIGIILAIAFMLFLGDRSRIGKAAALVLPEIRTYVASISLMLILACIFRIVSVLGAERSTSLIVMAALLLCTYLVAMLPKSTAFLARQGYPEKGVHVVFLTLLAVTILGFVLRLVAREVAPLV